MPRTDVFVPHAYPWLLLDRITALVPGRSAVAIKQLTRADPLLDSGRLVPAALLAEALAQCAGVAVLGARSAGRAFVARIDRFRSRTIVGAGRQMWVAVRVVKIFGHTAKVRGVVRVGGRACAAGEVVLQLGESSGEADGGGR